MVFPIFFSYLDLFGYTVLYAVFGFGRFCLRFCGFADEFFSGFAVSGVPQCPPQKYDDASKDAFYQVEELIAPVNSSFYYIKVNGIPSANKLIKTIRYPHM